MRRPHSSSLTPDIPPTYRTLRRASKATWYVCRTNPRCEKRAAIGLASKGFSVFLPVRTAWVRHSRQRFRAEYPLFARYLFVGLASPQHLPYLRGVNGIEGVLRNHDVPVKVPAEVIDELSRVCASGAYDETLPRPVGPLPAPGERIKIIEGPFASFGGVVKAALSSECIKILIDIFGRETLVKIPLEHLQAA